MLNQLSSANTTAADFSVNVRDELDNAKEALLKARHMLNMIFQEHDFSHIDDPVVTLMGIRGKPIHSWATEECSIRSWTQQVNETMTTIRIIDDYTEKAFGIIDVVGKDIEAVSQPISA